MANNKKTPRRLERVFAFNVLYGLCFTPAASEAELLRAFHLSPDRPDVIKDEDSFAWSLCFGVWKHREELDRAIADFSQNWRVERMGKVEATLLRIAMFELTRQKEVPPKVAINEAIELSKQFGDDKSRAFINGILDAAAKALEAARRAEEDRRIAAPSREPGEKQPGGFSL
ncbi:MAG: transcription antitermination factor NusB [Desulfovibrio sp.]|jgi:N utilization substance protein B|nr:transcription antitermination factor NusB [Desulfovibrio sp.]